MKSTVTCAGYDYDIVLFPPDAYGVFPIRVYQSNKTGVKPDASDPTVDILFFVILPDGNFIYLTQNLTSQVHNYEDSVRIESPGSTSFMYDMNTMEVTAFKKGNPAPPPSYAVKHNDYGYSGSGTSTFTPPSNVHNASDYLGTGASSIKIGASWTPWDASPANVDNGEFYYLIITYANRTGSAITTGTIDLDSCGMEATGFSPTTYTAFNLGGNKMWNSNTNLPLGNIFTFQNLMPEEVRHIYIKMTIVGNVTPSYHQFTARMKWGTVDTLTECLKVKPGTVPHDPNGKEVDQTACTMNGVGNLIYTIHYQNIGNGYADMVEICDKFPRKYIKVGNVNLIGRSTMPPVPVKTEHPWLKLCNEVKYKIGEIGSTSGGGHQLPGLTQSDPRRFTYDETIEWIQISTKALCPDSPKKLIKNTAEITFFDQKGTEFPVFITNPANTKPDDKERPNKWIVRPSKGKP